VDPQLVEDLDLAERVVRAAGTIVLGHLGASLELERKEAATDVATIVDRQAEAAAVALLRAERPTDGVLGEEGTSAGGERRWIVDALDGTLNFVSGVPGWCSAVALVGPEGPRVAAVWDAQRDELFSAAAGGGCRINGRPVRVRERATLDEALVSTYVFVPRLGLPGVRAVLTALVERVGAPRMIGSGTLELAWVAAGRLDGWLQPNPYPWDWWPGALLVREAGGVADALPGDPAWHVAGSAPLTGELAALVRSAQRP
jgi:myo-inositol-1(or 4)-monophosphatase